MILLNDLTGILASYCYDCRTTEVYLNNFKGRTNSRIFMDNNNIITIIIIFRINI